MTSELFVVGLSWRTAPVAVREQLAFDKNEIEAVLTQLGGLSSIGEAVVISTCNRVEVYGTTPRAAPASELAVATSQVRSFLSRSQDVSSEDLARALYEYTDNHAIRHMFRVASALDSMVLGETQILGQLKQAYGLATRLGVVGPVLGRCLERAFSTAKRVRTETEVSRGAANVSSVAVELARKVFGDLDGKSVLVVGAGKMSALAARHLRAAGASKIWVANRSLQNAQRIAQQIDGVARDWRDLDSLLRIADVVVSSTNARQPVLTEKQLRRIVGERRYRPVVIIDIAVPRDVESGTGRLDGVYLFDIDDLEQVVAQNLKDRAKEAEHAQRIVDGEVKIFRSWMRSQRVVPTIRSLRRHFDGIASAEVHRALRNLPNDATREQYEDVLRRVGDGIVRKLLHSPMSALKGDDERKVESLLTSVQQLFSLSSDEGEPEEARRSAGIGEHVKAGENN